MFDFKILFISALWSWVGIVSASQSTSEAFMVNDIVPDLISTPPHDLIKVKYGSKNVNLGTELSPLDVLEAPDVSWNTDDDKDSLYTLFLVDVDVPTREDNSLKSFVHWLVVNIKCSDVSTGTAYRDYTRPLAALNTSPHRYVFLIYKQPASLEYNGNVNFELPKFCLEKFTEDYDLGDPVAGNFFQAKYSDTLKSL